MRQAPTFLLIVSMFLTTLPHNAAGQSNPAFDVKLRIDYSAAEEMLSYFERQTFNTQRVATIKGNQIAAATSEMLARQRRAMDDFAHQLEFIRDNYETGEDVYGLRATRSHTTQLRALLTETTKRQLDRRVLATIASYFPTDAQISVEIPVYVVAMGNEKAAAFVRRVIWRNDRPVFTGEDQGEQVIVLNIARMLDFESKVDAQFIQLLSTLAHESFHAVFGAYQEKSSVWKEIHSRTEPIWRLTDIVQNEGIAYYLSLQLQIGGRTPPPGWFDQTSRSVVAFNNAAGELLSPTVSAQRARELIMNSNLSGSFQTNYGATAGLRFAYEIDTRSGRPALTETIKEGIGGFFRTYDELCRKDSDLPRIDEKILKILKQ